MPGPWVSELVLQQDVADILKLQNGIPDLEDYWLRMVTKAQATGYSDVKAILMGRGYTMDQLDAWDDREIYNRQQSLFWLYTETSLGMGYDDKEIDKLDRREFLKKEETIMIGDIATPPGATGDASMGAAGGMISEDGYRVDSNTTW